MSSPGQVARVLVIMGSGETSPTMVKTHRAVIDRLGPAPVPAVLLDTPFGFQENADDITARAVHYFSESVGTTMEVVSFRSGRDADDVVAHERMMGRLRTAKYVFAGPGSPTYALSVWADSAVPGMLAEKLTGGGAVCFASAAALTLGLLTVPVYEIYKVGAEPRWLPGLDLLAVTGLRAAVIPHYNNAEGGNHDTRFCYLGERRLARMEEELPEGAFVLGVDEHTGLVIDVETGAAEVVGLGVVTVRAQGRSETIVSGQRTRVDELAALAVDLAGRRGGPGTAGSQGAGEGASAPARPGAPEARAAATADPEAASAGRPTGTARSPLLLAVETRQREFDAAVGRGDADGATAAILGLETDLAAWSADTLQSDELDRGRAALRSMVAALGELAATGMRDPAKVVGPYVELVLAHRRTARSERRYADADALRDGLVALGVEVMDGPEGTVWELADPP